jgi:hypothetical protein
MDDDWKSNTEQQLKLQYQKEQQMQFKLEHSRCAAFVFVRIGIARKMSIIATASSRCGLHEIQFGTVTQCVEKALAGLKRGTEEDRERANALKEEILSAYNVEESKYFVEILDQRQLVVNTINKQLHNNILPILNLTLIDAYPS